MKMVADGITILNQYGRFRNACWVLHNGNEAAVVEMPPYSRGRERAPHMDVLRFIRRNRLSLKYALLSHPHWDHCKTLLSFRQRFPRTPFVAHSSFFEMSDSVLAPRRGRMSPDEYRRMICRIFQVIFSGDVWKGTIGGEPLYIIHAPKHSYTDLLIVFKGAMITGDWYIGDLRDCTALVSRQDKIASINKVIRIMKSLKYNIHMLFSAHGNHLFYDADFYSILRESRISHRRSAPALRARCVNI